MAEAEPYPEQLDRVRSMAQGNDVWDLSPNDCAALTAVLARVETVEGENARLRKALALAVTEWEAVVYPERGTP